MKKVKFRMCFAIVALTLILVSSCSKEDDTPNWQKIFDITLPSGWNSQSYNNENILYYAWSPFRIEDDEQLVEDTLNEDLLITRESLPGYDLDFYYTSVTALLSVNPKYSEVYSADTVINGQPSKKLIHLNTFKIPLNNQANDSVNLDVKQMKFFFFKDEYGYLVDFGAVPYTFIYYKPIFEDIIDSFTFIN